jgi:hypothetical protein
VIPLKIIIARDLLPCSKVLMIRKRQATKREFSFLICEAKYSGINNEDEVLFFPRDPATPNQVAKGHTGQPDVYNKIF